LDGVAINFYLKMGLQDRSRMEYEHDGNVSVIAHLVLIFDGAALL
jgi:hypothetical protein